METDYLVVGADPENLAFVDALLRDETSCTVVIADTRGQPGGHWNDLPSFARLDQPNSFFGVTSLRLGAPLGRAWRDEVLGYLRSAMDSILETGRVRYFPMCSVEEAEGGVRLTPILDEDQSVEVQVRRRIVESACACDGAPGCPFEVSSRALIVLPRILTSALASHPLYVVIGAGRTGIDTVLWLLSVMVPPDRIRWVMPRDAWFYTRESWMPERLIDTTLKINRATTSLASWTRMQEAAGILCRVDEARAPEAFRQGCFLSQPDLAQLRRVRGVIRLGRVLEVSDSCMTLERGVVDTAPGALYVDCTGRGPLDRRRAAAAGPIWERAAPRGGVARIRLQHVKEAALGGESLQSSAAVIARLEARLPHAAGRKNAMCTPIGAYDTLADCLHLYSKESSNTRPWTEGGFVGLLHCSAPAPTAALSMKDLRHLITAYAQGDWEGARRRMLAGEAEAELELGPVSPAPIMLPGAAVGRRAKADTMSTAISEGSTSSPDSPRSVASSSEARTSTATSRQVSDASASSPSGASAGASARASAEEGATPGAPRPAE